MNIKKLFPWFLRRSLKDALEIPDMWNTLYRIQKQSFEPKIIFDVGAFRGDWSKNCLKIFPNAKYYLFEPQDKMIKYLTRIENEKIKIENLFLGKDDGSVVKFYEAETSSSALRFGPHTSVNKVSTSLETYCKDNSINNIDVLKLDVQGYELNILKGAQSIFNNIQIIILEVSLIDVYIDCPLVSDIIFYLDKNEYQLFDIVDFKHRELDNNLWQCDMFFVRKNSYLIMDKRKDKKQLRPK